MQLENEARGIQGKPSSLNEFDMIKAKLTEDGKFIHLSPEFEIEQKQLLRSFTRKIQNWYYHPLVRKKLWTGEIKFIDKFNRIPVGLYNELKVICKKYDIELDFNDEDKIIDPSLDRGEFEEWVWDFFKDDKTYGKGGYKEIRDYQIDAPYKILKARRSCSEIATSAGKTLMIYIILSYLLDKGLAKRCVIVVPNTSLIIQTMEDFEEYNDGDKIPGLQVQGIHGGSSKIKTDAQIIIGTFQSLCKLDDTWFEDVDVVCVDEAHYTNCKSVRDIITKCSNNKYSFGLSGTLKKKEDTADHLNLQSYLGPFVNDIAANFLIDNDYATKVFIRVVKLNYLDGDVREKLAGLIKNKQQIEGSKLLALEKKIVNENRARFKYVCEFISKSTKNSLVLFQDIKNGYGRNIYDWLRENTNKNIYYVDGGTDAKLRDDYFNSMRENDNCILVASYGTLSTGVSINQIYNIFFVESYKSDKIIRQSIGRGMRKQEGKDRVTIIDFVDDFSWKGTKNYLLKHGEERMKIYDEQHFPYKVWEVDLVKPKTLF